MAGMTPPTPGPTSVPSPSPAGGGGMPSRGIPKTMPAGTKIPPEIAQQIDNLPPGGETAIKLCKNPAVAALASVALTLMGVTVSPQQVMQAAEFGSAAIDARKAEKADEHSQGKSNTPG